MSEETQEECQCRKCKKRFVPDFHHDFYQDDKDGPGTGLCERCMMDEAFNSDPKPLPNQEFSDTVCQKGKGAATCCFLAIHTAGGLEFRCAKGSGLNNTIVQRVREGSMVATSLNCDGPPSFTPLEKPKRWDSSQGGFVEPS